MGWFKRPSRTIVLVEQVTDKRLIPQNLWNTVAPNDQIFVYIDLSGVSHNGKGNMLFLDGHIKTVPGLSKWQDAMWPDGSFMFHEDIGDFGK
jgi:prepilin-type processing-associated H-X9-DG protein